MVMVESKKKTHYENVADRRTSKDKQNVVDNIVVKPQCIGVAHNRRVNYSVVHADQYAMSYSF